MKIIFSEAPPDYATYTFPYAIYAMQENEEEIPAIYDRGFLPYTDTRFRLPEAPFYYLARSIRIRLEDFALTSENRRIRRKMESLAPRMHVTSKAPWRDNEAFWQFCRRYAAGRIGEAMSSARLQYIFDHPLTNRLFVFENNEGPLGYVWAVDRPPVLHYWFAFYDTRYLPQGLGKWMMEQVISYARQAGYRYVYLGTCYGSKALYKVRDFRAIEYFDGNGWHTDIKRLKARCREDGRESRWDEWKALHRVED